MIDHGHVERLARIEKSVVQIMKKTDELMRKSRIVLERIARAKSYDVRLRASFWTASQSPANRSESAGKPARTRIRV